MDKSQGQPRKKYNLIKLQFKNTVYKQEQAISPKLISGHNFLWSLYKIDEYIQYMSLYT